MTVYLGLLSIHFCARHKNLKKAIKKDGQNLCVGQNKTFPDELRILFSFFLTAVTQIDKTHYNHN